MIIIKCDGVEKNDTINFIYFNKNSMLSKNFFIDLITLEEINKSKDFRNYNKTEIKIIKECLKYANNKDSFLDNKSYSFKQCYLATIALNNVVK